MAGKGNQISEGGVIVRKAVTKFSRGIYDRDMIESETRLISSLLLRTPASLPQGRCNCKYDVAPIISIAYWRMAGDSASICIISSEETTSTNGEAPFNDVLIMRESTANLPACIQPFIMKKEP